MISAGYQSPLRCTLISGYVCGHAFVRLLVKKAPPGGPGGASGASAYSPFFLRLRDQIREEPSPSSSSNRLAKIGALKLGSSSLSER